MKGLKVFAVNLALSSVPLSLFFLPLAFLGLLNTRLFKSLYFEHSGIQDYTRNLYYTFRMVPLGTACAQESLYFGAVPRPNSKCIFSNIEFTSSFSIDSSGARSSQQSSLTSAKKNIADRNPTKYILSIGDSHGFGYGVDDDQHYTALLHNQDYTAINLSVSGYSTHQELERLKNFKRKNPNIWNDTSTIIIQYCENDIDPNLQFLSKKRISPSLDEYERIKSRLNANNFTSSGYPPHTIRLNFLSQFASSPLTYVKFIKKFYYFNLWFVLNGFKPSLDKELSNNSIVAKASNPNHGVYFANILDRYAKVIQGKRVIILVSNSYGVGNLVTSSSLRNELQSRVYFDKGISVIDWHREGDQNNYYYIYDDHLNPKGHQKISGEIVKHLSR